MKTSTALRQAVDQFLNVSGEYEPNREYYLCFVLSRSEISVAMQQRISLVFIDPETKSKNYGLYRTSGWELTEKGKLNRQCTRFMLAEFIACYYEGIGD